MSQPVPSFSTVAIHAGDTSARVDRDTPTSRADARHGALAAIASEGAATPPGILEERIAALEGGTSAVAAASGGSALRIAFHLLLRKGDEVVAPRQLGGDSLEIFAGTFEDFGWKAAWADIDDPDSFESAIGPRTKAIFVESIGKNGGAVADLDRLAVLGKRAGVPLVVDNTHATSYLCRPLDHRADVVVHTSLDLLAGQGDCPGGLIVDGGTFDWAREGRYPALSDPRPELDGASFAETFGNLAFAMAARVRGLRDFGPALSAADARSTLAGIETLSLRLRRQTETATALADWLSNRREVAWLRFPGIAGDRHHNLARRYLPNGVGHGMTFGLAGGEAATDRLVGRLQVVAWGGTGNTRSRMDRLITVGRGPKSSVGARAPEGAIAFSVGLEERDDLIADLAQALAAD